MAAKDRAGKRFDAYAVDYGCYVDLLATRGAAPRGLFRTGDDEFIDVPPDDLDVIRGAILELDSFSPEDSAGRPSGGPEDLPAVSVMGHAREGHTKVDSAARLQDFLAAPGWYLLVEGKGGIVAVPVGRRAVRIGSSSNDHVRIRHASVVPRHAAAEVSADSLLIFGDQGDSVYVNDRKVRVSNLVDRDHVVVGAVDLLVVQISSGS